jgi:hypothetical protein
MSIPRLVCVQCRHGFVPGDETWVFIHDKLPWLNHAVVQCPDCGFVAPMKLPFKILKDFLKYDFDCDYESGIHFVFLDNETRHDADDAEGYRDDDRADDGPVDLVDPEIADDDIVEDDDPAESVPAPVPPARVAGCPKCRYRYPMNSGYCYLVIYDEASHFDHVVGCCPNPACNYRQRFFDRQLVQAVADADDNIREYWFIKPGPRMIREFRRSGLTVEADPADLAELKVFFRSGIPGAWASRGFRPDAGGPDRPPAA